jgi:hypothetical protein
MSTVTVHPDPLEELPDVRVVCARLETLEREELRLRQLLRLIDRVRQDRLLAPGQGLMSGGSSRAS